MLWAVIISGLTLGAAGSLHCVGMCGPLSLALPVRHLSTVKQFFYILSYQLGRILTYSVIGLIFGLAGRRIYISGYQQWFSIGMGILVLVFAVLYFLQSKSVHLPFFNRFYLKISQLISKVLKSAKGPGGFFTLGMANGLLPCGLVYVAVAATLSFQTVTDSILFMASFGAGTLPAMMIVGMAGKLLHPEARMLMRKAVPVFVTLMGVVLILRGLNLGIPYISPILPGSPGDAAVCHPQ